MSDSELNDASPPIDLSRVLVLGSSCSGKSTFARDLSLITGTRHVELDALHWGPNWRARPHDELADEVRDIAQTPNWIVDGCYFALQSILWPRATAAIWLNYPFQTVGWRATKRTFRRVSTRERLYSDNRESLVRALFSRDSILLWVVTSYPQRRQEIPEQRRRPEFSHLAVREFKHPRQASRFLESLADASSD